VLTHQDVKAAQALQQILRQIQKMFNLGLRTGLNLTWNHGIMNSTNPMHRTQSERRPAGNGPRLAEFDQRQKAPRLPTFPLLKPDEQEARMVTEASVMLPPGVGGTRPGGWFSGV